VQVKAIARMSIEKKIIQHCLISHIVLNFIKIDTLLLLTQNDTMMTKIIRCQ